MSDRARQRVGRNVTYFPTDAEAAAGGGDADDEFHASIARSNPDGTVNLHVVEADGGLLAKTDVEESNEKGGFSFRSTEATM